MLGQFLELALATADIAASVHFYEQLGFSQLHCTDSWPHPYCALGDGHIVLGLHQRATPSAALCFVHADLARYRLLLEASGFAMQDARLGEDQFHQLWLSDPDQHEVLLLEARTYSPAVIRADASRCGELLGWSLPTRDAVAAARFWEQAGLVAFTEQSLPYPHWPLSGDGLNLALHVPGSLPGAALVYTAPDLPRRLAVLHDLGLGTTAWSPPGAPQARGALLRAPEGTLLALLPG